MTILPKIQNDNFISMSYRSFAFSHFHHKKKTPFAWHQVRAWSEAKGEDCSWKEYEEQLNPLKPYGGDKVNFEGDISPSNKDRGNSKEYQLQRIKRDAPDIATKVINREISAKHGAKRKNPPSCFLRRCVLFWATRSYSTI